MPAAAEEDYFSANYLLPGCKEAASDSPGNNIFLAWKSGRCTGAVETLTYFSKFGCFDPPPRATVLQELQVVVRYIEARPHRTHENFKELALEALREAWPCRGANAR